MPRLDLVLETPVERTARVMQLEGIYDVPGATAIRHECHALVPIEEKPWSVGLIVGPSGAGKSTAARKLFGDFATYEWNRRAVVDNLGDSTGIKEILAALSAVGLSSPPAWRKPNHVLSTGDRARLLRDPTPRVVCDEFTSVVDRQVAQIGSHALAKAIRARAGKKFVAVTCHYDVAEWLQPDWVFEPHTGAFSWRSLQRRPPIELEIVRAHSSAWDLFAPHHYLTADINPSAACFVALWNGIPVAFDAWLPFFGRLKDSRRARRGHRTVCLPDFQGVGIGGRLFCTVASAWKAMGYRAFSRTAHPAEIANRLKSGLWRMTSAPGFTARDSGKSKAGRSMARTRTTTRRAASFEYIGPALELAQAKALVG